MPNEPKISSPIDRVRAVTEEIEKQGEISHNKLLEIIVEKQKLMAKKTFEKTIRTILDSGLADYRNEKNLKIYYIESQISGHFHDLEKMIKDHEKKLPTTSKDFANKTLTEKANEVKWLFSLYQLTVSTSTIYLSAGMKTRTDYAELTNLMDRFLKLNMSIWKNDKDAKYLLAELLVSLARESPFFSELRKLYDEYENKL